MDMVQVHYKGEQALKKKDGKAPKGYVYKNNRCLLVKGKPYRLTEGVHEMPKEDYEKFLGTPVGKLLDKRGVLSAKPLAKKKDKPAEKPAAKKAKKSKSKK